MRGGEGAGRAGATALVLASAEGHAAVVRALLVVGAHGVRVSPGGLGLGREEVAQPQKPVLLGGDSSTWSYSASTAPSSYSVFDTWATKHGKPYAGAGLYGGLDVTHCSYCCGW